MKVKVEIDGGAVLVLPVYVEFAGAKQEIGTIEVTLEDSHVEVVEPSEVSGVDF